MRRNLILLVAFVLAMCGGCGGGSDSPGGGKQGNAVAVPTFSPSPGTYSSGQSVTLSTTTPGATIRYTTDGSTPTPSTGLVYAGAISVDNTSTINAIACMTGLDDSRTSTGTDKILGIPSTGWTWVSKPGNTHDMLGAAYGGGQFVAVGGYGFIVSSGDGITRGREYIAEYDLGGIAFGGGKFVAVGAGGSILRSN